MKKNGDFNYGGVLGLTDRDWSLLMAAIGGDAGPVNPLLGGRGGVKKVRVGSGDCLVLKQYLRGGWLRVVNRQFYLRWGVTRGKHEYDCLNYFRDLGGSAPEPLLYVEQGQRFYQAWLATREIPEAVTLADLSLSRPEQAKLFLEPLLGQIELLISNNIYHISSL